MKSAHKNIAKYYVLIFIQTTYPISMIFFVNDGKFLREAKCDFNFKKNYSSW